MLRIVVEDFAAIVFNVPLRQLSALTKLQTLQKRYSLRLRGMEIGETQAWLTKLADKICYVQV